MGQGKSKHRSNGVMDYDEAQYSVRNPGAVVSPTLTESAVRGSPAKLDQPTSPPPSSDQDSPEPCTSKILSKATVDDFELLSVVGRGQWGKVLMVRKKDTDQIFAMKVIRKEYMLQKNQVANVKSERTLLELIKCPYIVHLHFAFQTDDKLYLILDWVNGGELFFHLKREGRFDENRVRFYVAEMVIALEHLHNQNVLYRDLKPENVLLDAKGHVRLVDFGLSKQFKEDDARTYTFCGTPEYLAPEVLTGEGYTLAVDWWCLGSLMYEMLVGLPPYYSDNIEEMYKKIMTEAPIVFPDSMSATAKDLIKGLLAYDKEKRLGSASAGGPERIRQHPFFYGMDFRRLEKKEVPAPFIPNVESPMDTRNFDTEFTQEPAVDSFVERQMDYTVVFDSFSYTTPSMYSD